MISQSIHAKLSRVRKPRVHITYDVETEGAVIQKELPFVVGVIGDFSGKPTPPLPPLKDRKFVQIDRDNFNEVLERMRPALTFKAPNLLKGDGSELPVGLNFESMEDFEPGRVARKIGDIATLLDIRNKLQELLTKADRSSDLENLLEQIVQNENMRKELAADIEHSASTTSTESQTAALPEEKKS
jgi:type VI secretion system protein ImpB